MVQLGMGRCVDLMVHDDPMAYEIIERTLWYEAQNGRAVLRQADLQKRTEPLVILGEAGMGKSYLLEWLASTPGYAGCTARQLINRHNPRTLLGEAQVLVIDALDEVSIQKEGDAVDLVLRRLGELDYPRFILSCRVAEWRSATGLEAIREQYAGEPLELHLEPFDDDDAIAFLSASLGVETAKSVVAHFNAHGLYGLLGNPQTLELISRVAGTGDLPRTRCVLFERAIEVLRVEHRDAKAGSQPAREAGLDAAGAAFATLILTGNEVIVRRAAANVAEGELPLADICRLPGGEAVAAMLGTRLFAAGGADQFKYWHRRIGEYLGAYWLAKLADTKRKRRRLLSLFHSHGLVPASLRGIHAWLARDPALAPTVIAADPMGVIEYGNADDLTVEQARLLLRALEVLATVSPGFRNWGQYSARGIAQTELADDVRRLITAPETPFGVRLLVLGSIKGTKIAASLANELKMLVLDKCAVFACRRAAGEVLVDLVSAEGWVTIVRTLHGYNDDLSARLAIELVDEAGYEPFDNNLIVDLVVAYTQYDGRTVGVLMRVQRRLPVSRIEGVLERFAEVVTARGESRWRPGDYDYDLTDFAYHLTARRVAHGSVTAEKLWAWLEPFGCNGGYLHGPRQQLDELIRDDESLRRDVQRLILLEQPGVQTPRQRVRQLIDRLPCLAPTPGDVIALLQSLDPANRSDERWRDVIQLVQHSGQVGAEVRAAARPFAVPRSDLLAWIEKLAKSRVPEWQVKQTESDRKRRSEQAIKQAEQRKNYAAEIDRVRAGDYGAVINPAKAYLNLFRDIGDGIPAHERVTQWLGQDIGDAANEGFEAFLLRDPPKPTAQEIASSLAQGKLWEAAYIIIAAFSERRRNGRGFDDLSDERLMAGLFALRQTDTEEIADIKGLEEAIEEAIQARGIWGEAMRLYHEPQLQARCEQVLGLYALMHDDVHSVLGAELAAEWLERFPDLPASPEAELIDRLIRSGRFEDLRRVAAGRVDLSDDERRRNWDAVGLIVDFERTVARLEASPIEPELLWHLRRRTGGRFGDSFEIALSPEYYQWVLSTFRLLWPLAGRPNEATVGDTNPWDASEHLTHLIRRLGNDACAAAVAALKSLQSAPVDGYTETIQVVVAEQARICVEAVYAPPTLDAIDAIVRDRVPVAAADLQALMMEELAIVQAKVKSDDAESWRGFYDDKGVPFAEERCRDHLLGLLRQASEGITLDPETHVAADKEVDIACSVGALRMPIEVKGQWHPDLWHGADRQLDTLYTQDWRAEGRGIYLVLWFGDLPQANKRIASPGRGTARPQTPDELHKMLVDGSNAARDGRVTVFVLDLERS